ncbi:MAG: M3 family oligoendopeptidase [Balneolales bacterium]
MANRKNRTGAEQINWDLSDLYEGVEDPRIQQDKQRIRDLADQFSKKYRTMVLDFSPAEMREALSEYEKIHDLSGRVGAFAYLIWTTNTEDATYGKLVQEMNEFSSEISQKLVFFDLEWLDMEEALAANFIHHPELARYRHYLETSRQFKPHKLDEKEEQLLSAKSVTGSRAWIRYFDETLGAARFELDGQLLTEQEVLSKIHEPDRQLRKRAAESVTAKLKDLSRSTTFVFNTLVADKYTNDKFRNFPGWITGRNLSNEISDESVESLIQSVTSRYDLPQRFYNLKKRLLGLEELMEYDRYAPIEETVTRINWTEAKGMVLDSYSRFHPELGGIASRFFDNNWIDAAIKPGKRGGAYSAGTVPSAHPYVFMNYDGKIRDVQTLAHELGHGVHQYLSRDQGVLQAHTPLTTAETASVFGEMLVFQNILKSMQDPKEQLSLLVGKIDDTIATVFRQISMNRFEDALHRARRMEGELTTGRISELWIRTQKELYGSSVTLTPDYEIWWSYIPHFIHTPGYVYAYAFGELLVLALYEQYTRKPDGFSDKYMDLLKAGGSDWPENLLAKMDMDINSVDFWKNGLHTIETMIQQAETLAGQVQK